MRQVRVEGQVVTVNGGVTPMEVAEAAVIGSRNR
jgi:hypothetical protein